MVPPASRKLCFHYWLVTLCETANFPVNLTLLSCFSEFVMSVKETQKIVLCCESIPTIL